MNPHQPRVRIPRAGPTNCVHVSQRVVDHAKQQDLFVPGVGSDQNASYLAKVGSWQEKKQQLVENFDK